MASEGPPNSFKRCRAASEKKRTAVVQALRSSDVEPRLFAMPSIPSRNPLLTSWPVPSSGRNGPRPGLLAGRVLVPSLLPHDHLAFFLLQFCALLHPLRPHSSKRIPLAFCTTEFHRVLSMRECVSVWACTSGRSDLRRRVRMRLASNAPGRTAGRGGATRRKKIMTRRRPVIRYVREPSAPPGEEEKPTKSKQEPATTTTTTAASIGGNLFHPPALVRFRCSFGLG